MGAYPFTWQTTLKLAGRGSLALKPGINIVAGTGSIAFGKSRENVSARSGGWSTFFGDEGSCYWLGRRTMELFTKQADGRVKEGELYHILKRRAKNPGYSGFYRKDGNRVCAQPEQGGFPAEDSVFCCQGEEMHRQSNCIRRLLTSYLCWFTAWLAD